VIDGHWKWKQAIEPSAIAHSPATALCHDHSIEGSTTPDKQLRNFSAITYTRR
jgi:hypothetical protein